MKYDVCIQETLSKTITVEAESKYGCLLYD